MIDIYLVDIGKFIKDVYVLRSLLSSSEKNTANQFKFEKDHNSYVITHAWLRKILGLRLSCNPATIMFKINDYGKPFLPSANKVYFNLSHSGGYSLIAVSEESSVGIDIEYIKPIDFEEIVNNFFHLHEKECFFKQPIDKRLLIFYELWTRKEALIKADGKGLLMHLNSFDVSSVGICNDIFVQNINIIDGYLGAVGWKYDIIPQLIIHKDL